MILRWLKRSALTAAVLLLAAQAVPYGRDHTNPPVTGKPAWPSPRVRELAKRACFDCHSNETVWPWYSNIPPFSVLIQNNTVEGRAQFNVSEWGRPENEGGESAELLQNGETPPRMYLLMHPSAQLNASEQQELVQGLLATFGCEGGEGGEGEE